jgi:IPT/TIG domain
MALLCLALAALALPEANAQTVTTSPVPSTGASPFNTTDINNIVALGGIAVDSKGNVFVGATNFNSTGNGEIIEFTPTTTTPPFTYPNSSNTNIAINTAGTAGTANTGCNLPNRLPGDSNPNIYGEINQMTVDKNDTIWIADNSGPVWEIAKGSTTATCNTNISDTPSSNTIIPVGIAVDSNLNVFVSDNSNNVIREYLNSETYITAHTFFTASSGELGALAIDSQNNLYVINTINNNIVMFPGENASNQKIIFSVSSPKQLNSVSALPNSDLIVIDNGGDDNGPSFVAGNIFKLTPASPTFTSTTLTPSPATPSGFDPDYAATDSNGDVFVGETSWVVINTCGGTPCANTTSIVQFSLGGAVSTVSSLSPTSGPNAGGTSVTINGTNFTSPATVKFGTNAATNVDVVSATEITAVSPAGSSGTVDVTVTTSAGTSQTSANDQFTYDVSGPTAATAIPSEILTQNHGASFTPVTGSGGAAPLAYSVSPLLPRHADGHPHHDVLYGYGDRPRQPDSYGQLRPDGQPRSDGDSGHCLGDPDTERVSDAVYAGDGFWWHRHAYLHHLTFAAERSQHQLDIGYDLRYANGSEHRSYLYRYCHG